MLGYPLYVLLLAGLIVWVRRRPNLSLGRAAVYWWAGLLLLRLFPLLFEMLPSTGAQRGPTAIRIEMLVAAFGALLLLRSVAALTLTGREWRRRTRVSFGFLVFGLLLGGVPNPTASVICFVIFSLPWLSCVSWTKGLSASRLLFTVAGALMSMLLSVVSFGEPWRTDAATTIPALPSLVRLGIAAICSYSLIVFFRVPGRIHLSILRISHRLTTSHLMAALVPAVLGTLFLLLGGSMFLSSYRGDLAVRALRAEASDARRRVLIDVARGRVPSAPFGDAAAQAVVARYGDQPIESSGELPDLPIDRLLTLQIRDRDAPLLWDRRRLFLRVRVDTVTALGATVVEAMVQIDSTWTRRLSEIVGVEVSVAPRMTVQESRSGIQIGGSDPDSLRTAAQAASGPGLVGKFQSGLRLPGGTTVQCIKWNGRELRTSTIPILTSAAFGEPIAALFEVAKGNPLAKVGLILLAMIAVFFVGTMWTVSSMVRDMIRSVTQTVGVLRDGARSVGQGKLDHRIVVEGQDELWSVASSFNQMAAGLEKVREVELNNQRLEEELRLAREIQDRLFPAEAPTVAHLELAGVSLPARQVGGDYFDYMVLDDGRVAITVADVSGKGAAAALLMSSFRASLRALDLGALGPAESLSRLNRFVHSSVEVGKFITAFLGLLDPRTGELVYSCAGHEPPLVIDTSGNIEALSIGGLILGLFPDALYEEGRLKMPAGSLLAVFTDGVTDAQSPSGEFYGEERLRTSLRHAESEKCQTLLNRVVTALHDFADTRAQFDDITMVLARRV